MTNMKFLTARFKSKDEEKREITAFASAPTLDRDREVVRADAWELADFKKHPVLVLSHDYQKLWVGKITEILTKLEGLFFKAIFGATAAANEVWELIKSTGIAAFSVGFLPIASENVLVKNLPAREQRAALAAGLRPENSILVHTKVQLLEISIVSVPSNTSATLLSWKSLAKTAALRDALEEITISDSDVDPEEVWAMVDKAIRQGMKEAVEAAVVNISKRMI